MNEGIAQPQDTGLEFCSGLDQPKRQWAYL